MVETTWTPLPYPLSHYTHACPLPPLDASTVITRLLEDTAGLMTVIAVAAQQAECDQDSMRFATRFVAELAQTTVALWREWQEQKVPAWPTTPAHDA